MKETFEGRALKEEQEELEHVKAEKREKLIAHLRECESCRNFLTFFLELQKVTRAQG